MFYVVFRDSREQWRWSLHGDDRRKLTDSGTGFTDQWACLLSVDEARRALNGSASRPPIERAHQRPS